MKRDDTAYLRHILDAIELIDKYVAGVTGKGFSENSLVRDAVIRQLEIIGEATKRVSPSTRALDSSVPWQEIAGMRDKLIHDYMGVDPDTVWLTIQSSLPPFKAQIRNILDRLT